MLKKIGKYLLVVLSILSINAQAKNIWYEGGTLHKADVATWKTATLENKLATAADWALVSPTIKARVQSSGDVDTNKPFAQELVACMDSALEGVSISGGITDIAVSCMVLKGWLK